MRNFVFSAHNFMLFFFSHDIIMARIIMLNAAPKAHSPSVDGCVCMCVRVW